MRTAFLAISIITTFAEMVDVLTFLHFAMITNQLDAAAIMRMLAADFPTVVAGRVITAAVAGHRMDHVRLTIWCIAMIAQNIIASGALVLHMLAMFFLAMIALGIFTSAIQWHSMSYMLAIFFLTMLTDYNLAKTAMLFMLTV